MKIEDPELKFIFDYLSKNPWCSAREIGRLADGGKSRVNHFLYKYKDVLFTKKGFTPPEWQVIGETETVKQKKVKPRKPVKLTRKSVFRGDTQSGIDKLSRYHGLPTISVCPSCDRPIQMSGSCGCT
jgi:hypothetical protein